MAHQCKSCKHVIHSEDMGGLCPKCGAVWSIRRANKDQHDSDSPSGETSYWVRRDNKIKGPRSRQRVITAINDRRLSPTDEISLTENGPWFPLEKWMNEDCNDEVLKTFEDEIEEFVSSESNQAANTQANLRRRPNETGSWTAEQAAGLVAKKAHKMELRVPKDLANSISKGTAIELAKFKGSHLIIETTKAIEKDVAMELAKFKGTHLYVNGPSSSYKDVAAALGEFRGVFRGRPHTQQQVEFQKALHEGKDLEEKLTWGEWGVAILIFLFGNLAIFLLMLHVFHSSKTTFWVISVLSIPLYCVLFFFNYHSKNKVFGFVFGSGLLSFVWAVFIWIPIIEIFSRVSKANWSAENWYLISWSFWPLSILTLCLFCISRLSLWVLCPVADAEEKKKVVFIGSILLAAFWLGWQNVYIRGERERYWESKLIRTESKLRAMERYNNRGYDDTGRPWYK